MEEQAEIQKITEYAEGLETLAGELIREIDRMNVLYEQTGLFSRTRIELIKQNRDTLLAYMQQASEKQDTYRCPLCCAPECSH